MVCHTSSPLASEQLGRLLGVGRMREVRLFRVELILEGMI